MAAPTPEWTGVIKFPNFGPDKKKKYEELDCWLYGSTGKAVSFSITEVHIDCPAEKTAAKNTKGKSAASAEAQQSSEKDEPLKPGETDAVAVMQDFCNKCKEPIPSNKKGKGLKVGNKLFILTKRDLAKLTFTRDKEVVMKFVTDTSDILTCVLPSRRLYIMPKPEYRTAYNRLLSVLLPGRVGLIESITLEKSPAVGIIRAVSYRDEFFGNDMDLLVLDLLEDPLILKNPLGMKGYPGVHVGETSVDIATQFNAAIAASRFTVPGLKLRDCLSPKSQALEEVRKRHEPQLQSV